VVERDRHGPPPAARAFIFSHGAPLAPFLGQPDSLSEVFGRSGATHETLKILM
jgi:hypothetical protein